MNNIKYEANIELVMVIIVMIALVYIFQYTIDKWSATKIKVAELEQNKVIHRKSERVFAPLPELTEEEKQKIDKELKESLNLTTLDDVVFGLMGEGDEDVKGKEQNARANNAERQ